MSSVNSAFQGIPDDFEATIGMLRQDEGGRTSAVSNGIRWDFAYVDGDNEPTNLYMIWPEFLDENGASMSSEVPLPTEKELLSRMPIVVDEMRHKIHRSRIKVGVRFYCQEGPYRVAEGVVTKITRLFDDRT